ncbi:glycosyltransferase, partial [Candidatus Sumerlaeota bacterium]|nr:glycosyltransferase [Candidatus Sumerlaeota bacterium]
VDLDIIGEGPLRAALETLARSNPRIHFLGSVPHDELPSHLHRATAFVLPSLYEGHPKTLIEAMACGLPVIATDVPGIREVITHGDTGFLCQTDSDSLRDGIAQALDDATLRESLGRRAREAAVEQFSLDRVVECELRLYHDVLERHGSR